MLPPRAQLGRGLPCVPVAETEVTDMALLANRPPVGAGTAL